MTAISGYTQGAICPFGTGWAAKVYPVAESIIGTDGVTVDCTLWLPVSQSYAPQSTYIDVAFGRRRRVYCPTADAQEGATRAVALDFDYSGVLTVSSVDGLSTRTENTKTVGVIA